MDDFDDFTPSRGSRAVLVERGRVFDEAGVPGTRYRSGDGRIAITVSRETLFLERRFGVVGPGLALSRPDWSAVLALLAHWRARRTSWGEWHSVRVPPHPYGSDVAYHIASGTKTAVRIGHQNPGDRQLGIPLIPGVNRRVLLAREVRVPGGFSQTHRLDRVDATAAGSRELVGALYRRGDVHVRAERGSIMVKRRRASVVLEESDEAALRVVLRLAAA